MFIPVRVATQVDKSDMVMPLGAQAPHDKLVGQLSPTHDHTSATPLGTERAHHNHATIEYSVSRINGSSR
jgi:hypothetical protein